MWKLIMTVGGGPLGWLAAAGTWILENWKLVLAALALAFVFFAGAKWNNGGWEEKWAARDAADAKVVAEKKRITEEIDGQTEVVEASAVVERGKREVVYRDVDREVIQYVEAHSKPAAPGACPTDTDIGADGLRLIERTRAALGAGAAQRK
jgi:hypothetical protein